jgi:hypothetical protein
MCFEDSSSSRHLSEMGSSVSPNLERCPLRWQRPVSRPTTHLNWSLLSLNRSFVLLAEGPCISSFACLSPVRDSQYSWCFLLIQSLTALLATPLEIPQAGSGPMSGWSDPVFANWSAISLPAIPSCPGTHISWTLLDDSPVSGTQIKNAWNYISTPPPPSTHFFMI